MKIQEKAQKKRLLWSFLICALALSILMAAAAPPEKLLLDPRITGTSPYSILVPVESWERPNPRRTDGLEQPRGCQFSVINIPGHANALRASNLAASKHYAEAIEELTKAIVIYDTPQRNNLTLNPEWVITRAKLLRLVGLDQKALEDIKRAVALKRSWDKEKYQCAFALIEFGEYAQAEAILQQIAESGSHLFRANHYYLLAIAQEKQGKNANAIASYREAATLFSSTGKAAPARACLDAIANLSSANNGAKPLSIVDLTPPSSNADKIKKLIKALMTRDDIFNMNKLKDLIGASEVIEGNSGYYVKPPQGHFRELETIGVRKLKTGGLMLRLKIDTTICALDRSAFEPYARRNVEGATRSRDYRGHSEEFNVPSGTILIWLFDDGFKSIHSIELYSKGARYPEPKKPPIPLQDYKNYSRQMNLDHWQRFEQLEKAEKTIDDWLEEEPDSVGAHAWKADLYASQGKYDEALKSIETAMKLRANANVQPRRSYEADHLLIKRGSYFLEQGKFKEAMEDFERGFPDRPDPDQLLLRGRAELGLRKYSEARNDLKAASDSFYNSFRIVKRDEVEKLLKTIPSSSSEDDSIHDAPPAGAIPETGSQGSPEDQKSKASMLMNEVEDRARAERLDKERRDQQALEKVTRELAEARQEQDKRPGRYILALLNMSRQCGLQKKTDEERKYIDRALDCYEDYGPSGDYDPCTRDLTSRLRIFKGTDLAERLDRLIRYTEPFCQNPRFRSERDGAILDCASQSLEEKKTLLERMIKIREEMQPATGVSSNQLYGNLSSIYGGLRDSKMAAWALKKAIEKSPSSSERASYHTRLASLYLRNKQQEEAILEWKKAGEVEDWKMSYGTARGFAELAKVFLQQEDIARCKEILLKSLQHANTRVLIESDDVLFDCIKKLERARQYRDAETLLRKRIEASKTSKRDPSLSEWQRRLSELKSTTEGKDRSESPHKNVNKPLPSNNKEIAKSISFDQVLYAFSELSLNGNTSTSSCDTRSNKSRLRMFWRNQENGDICSPGKVSINDSTTVFGTIYGKLSRDAAPQIATWTRAGKTKVVGEPLKQPTSLILGSSTSRTDLGDFAGGKLLSGGDYNATSLKSVPMPKDLTKPVRIFITDDSKEERYAVRLRGANDDDPPENLQIWYLGNRPIVFEHNSRVHALIYAPRSQVTMGDNNCTFCGAIVADRITTIGNVFATYDRALRGRVFTPSEAPAPLVVPKKQVESKEAREAARRERAAKFQEARDKQRALLNSRLSKYPALQKLDLLDGPVIYEEGGEDHKGSSGGGESDGRRFKIRGPNSIMVTGGGDGTLTIILDGQRLMDKAQEPLKKKDFQRAEEILVAALRAKPESEAFSMLADCWYRQKRYEEAFEACEMALEVDGTNKAALSLRNRLKTHTKIFSGR